MDILKDIVVTDVINAVTATFSKGEITKISNRENYGLAFCCSGKIVYVQNSERIVFDRHTAVILPKGQSYTIHTDKTGIFPVINFDCCNTLTDSIVTIPTENIEPILKNFEYIKKLLVFERKRQKVMSVFYDILHNLDKKNNFENDFIKNALQCLENNLSNHELTNKFIAKQCNISEVYLRKLFIKEFGVSPKQYIITLRINKACQLLTDGLLKISAVSEECGFSNPYHFCRLFKEKTGLTPSEFAKRNKVNKL